MIGFEEASQLLTFQRVIFERPARQQCEPHYERENYEHRSIKKMHHNS